MSSKRELRDELVMVKGDRELRRMEATALRNQRDALREEVIALSRERDRWRGAAQGVRNLLDPDCLDPFDVATLIRERDEARRELAATRKQRDAAVDAQYVDRELVEARDMVAELVYERNAALERVAKLGDIVSDLRARVAELEARVVVEWRDPDVPDRAERDAAWVDAKRWDRAVTTPEPRPFRVGDRVRVAEGATLKVLGGGKRRSESAGRVGVVLGIAPDGDLRVRPLDDEYDDWASPEFCTLIEDEPDDDTEQATADQAAEQVVRIHLADGQVLDVPGALVEIDGEWWVTSLDDESPRAWLNLEHVAVVVVR